MMDEYIAANIDEIQEAEKQLASKKVRKLNTPFGYFGSKKRIAWRLCSNLPPHNCWVEAFGGTAALTLAKPKAQIEVINDVDENITNLFKQLRDNHNELCRVVSLTPYARNELHEARKPNANDDEIERARKFLVQAMMAINGAFGSDKGGFSYSQSYSRMGKDARVSRWYNLPERITDVVERLRNVRIESIDARILLEKFANRPATLMYLDPPYLGERSEGYNIDANDKDFHWELLKIAKKSKSMIFISGYENPFYDEILTVRKGWNKKVIETNIKNIKGESFQRNEVVWTNKHFAKALETGKLPLRLTAKEMEYNKVNPIRK